MSTAAKGVVSTATITFNSVTYKVASAPMHPPVERAAVEVTSLSDTTKVFTAGALESKNEFTITVYDNGTAPSTSTAPAAFAITATIKDGADSASVSETFQALLTKVEAGSVDSDGDRKATLDLTFQPSGTAAAGNL